MELLRQDISTKEIVKVKEKPVILNLGDSFTWGMGVKADETFSYFLQKQMKDYQIINGGVGGAGLKEMYIMYENFENLKLVIITIMDADMLRTNKIHCGYDDILNQKDYEEAMQYSFSYLKKIVNSCIRKKIKVIITLWPRQIFNTKINYLSKLLRKFSEENNVYLIDDYSKYLSIYNNSRLIVSKKDWHPSVLAHKLIAKRLFDFIFVKKILL